MRLFCILLIASLHVSVFAKAQKITLNRKNITASELINEIRKQSGYNVMYDAAALTDATKVTVNISNAPLKEALTQCLQGLPLDYAIQGNNIIIFRKKENDQASVRQREITGNVSDEKGEPLPGTTVTIKGSSNAVTTDGNGNYRIMLTPGASALVFTTLGFETKEMAISDANVLNIVLKESVSDLDEVVVIGYGTVKKSDLTGAVGTLKGDQLQTAGVNTGTKALQGKLAGIEVESSGGNPGSGVRIMVRGVGTWNNNNPLYIIDGVQVANINNINPSDIASIDVLKDASAAAIYGSRAANGVVLVTTKSGISGKPVIQLNASYGVQSLPKKLDLLNGEEYARMSNIAHDAAGIPHLEIAANPEAIGKGTDWQDQIFRNAPVQNYELSMSGGNESSTYSVSLGYFGQEGIVKVTDYDRLNFRAKSQTKIGRFTFGETAILSKENTVGMPDGWGGQGGNPVGAAAIMIPIYQVYDPTAIGGFAGAYGPVVNVANPLAQLYLEDINNQSVNIMVNAFAQANLFKGLSYKLNLGYTNGFGYGYDYTRRYKVGTLFSNPTNNLTETSSQSPFVMAENTLNYDTQLGKHSIQALAGYTMQTSKLRTMSASVNNLPDGIAVLDAGTGSRFSGGRLTETSLMSWLGRVVYSYDGRYLMTASVRRDGSSRFGAANRFGTFPSVALGWNISQEDFFQPILSQVSQLKLRASYGILGNQEFDDYAYTASITPNLNYVTGTDGHLWPGGIQSAFVDPNLKWETTKTFNIGLDAAFFNNRLNFTADYYDKKTSDILLGIPIPGSAGASNDPITNAGTVRNRGLELSLSYGGGESEGGFKYNVTGTFSANKNTVLELLSGHPLFGGNVLRLGSTTTSQVGGPVGAFYLLQTDGLFNSLEEVQAHHDDDGKLIQPNARPGDIRFVDANHDGIISDLDKTYSGSPFPDFSYGLGFNGAWKNFDFSVFFQGTNGNKIYNGLNISLEGMNLEHGWGRSTLNAWTPENHTDFPRAVINDPNGNARVSDRFLENGSYLRMRSLQLGYTIPDKVLNTISLHSLRIYASFDNLFTISSYSGYNPDLGRTGSILDRGVDNGGVGYPLPRIAVFGIQLGL